MPRRREMTAPMFDVGKPGQPPMPLSRPRASSKPKWNKYRPVNPCRCDLCMKVLAERGGKGPFPRNARWRRQAPDSDLLLCNEHAQALRTEDEMPALKEK